MRIPLVLWISASRHLAIGCVAMLVGTSIGWLPPMALGHDIGEGMPLVFEEDFEKGRSRWETTDDGSWDWTEREGNHTLSQNKRISDYQPTVRSPHNIALIRELTVDDFVIVFRVRSINDTGNHRDCCVFFCHQDPDRFYYVHLGAKPDPASGQIMVVNREPRRPLTQNQRPVPWDDAWHTVKVSRESTTGRFRVYFDDMDEPLMQVEDKTFGAGRIGLGSFDDMNEFDDVRIYAGRRPDTQGTPATGQTTRPSDMP